MEKPVARLVNVQPFFDEGRELILLTDLEGITENPVVVSKDVLFLLSLMDGTRTLRELQEEYVRRFGTLIFMEKIEEVLDFLSKNYLLLDERFEKHYNSIKEEFERSPVRKAFHAGKSYPETKDELMRYIERLIEPEEENLDMKLKGLFAPHIDYKRGGRSYGKIYRYLKGVDAPLFIILGTSHQPVNSLINISSKDFVTPFGLIKNFFSSRKEMKEDPFFKSFFYEWPHRTEHSIELQLPFIQYFMGSKEFEILPILTGPLEECLLKKERKEEVDKLILEFKEKIENFGIPYFIIAGVDLAHIGLQFGDEPLDEIRLFYSKSKDQALLKSLEDVNPENFFNCVKEEKNERRICGFSALYLQLSLLKGSKGKIIDYIQWTDRLSSVSFASGLFYEP